MLDNITLQINISPGDINYAMLTVPELVRKHPAITHKLLVVDCCRPQKTKIVNPDIKFPIHEFNLKVLQIKEIALSLQKQCGFDEVFYLEPNSPVLKHLSKKYLGNTYLTTHAGGGTANMSYWAAIDLPKTKYVLHYDGDILLYQNDGYDWAAEALSLLKNEPEAIMAVPRLCPPVSANLNLISYHEGRPLIVKEHYWMNDWFSTRHFLLDKSKLKPYLPLVQGKLKYETLLRKWLNRVYPFDPEIVFFKALSPKGCKRIILNNTNAWILHPQNKPQNFIDILPQIINNTNNGKYPSEQEGFENININAWEIFINE